MFFLLEQTGICQCWCHGDKSVSSCLFFIYSFVHWSAVRTAISLSTCLLKTLAPWDESLRAVFDLFTLRVHMFHFLNKIPFTLVNELCSSLDQNLQPLISEWGGLFESTAEISKLQQLTLFILTWLFGFGDSVASMGKRILLSCLQVL